MAFPRLDKARQALRSAKPRATRGNTALEFGLVIIVAVPLLYGTVALGITVGRSIQAIQVARDAGHMYGQGVDFTVSGAQNILSKLAQGYSLTNSGDSVIIFSKIIKVYDDDCTAANVTPCSNSGSTVFTQRVTLGNTGLRASAFGTPPAAYVGAQGDIAKADYFKRFELVASGFDSLLSLGDGDIAYVTEAFFNPSNINFLSYGFPQATQGTYVRFIF